VNEPDPLSVRVPAAPFVMVISEANKPVTLSLNAMEKFIGDAFVGEAGAVTVHVGATESYTALSTFEAVPFLLAASLAALARTWQVTVPCAAGVTDKV